MLHRVYQKNGYIIKIDVQITKKATSIIFSILDLQRLAKALKNLVTGDKEKMEGKKPSSLEHYLKGLMVKIVKSEGK